MESMKNATKVFYSYSTVKCISKDEFAHFTDYLIPARFTVKIIIRKRKNRMPIGHLSCIYTCIKKGMEKETKQSFIHLISCSYLYRKQKKARR